MLFTPADFIILGVVLVVLLAYRQLDRGNRSLEKVKKYADKLQGDLSAWFGSNPVVPAACTDGSGMQTKEGCTANGMDDFEKIHFWTTPKANCSQGEGACVPYYRWVSDYIGVIGGR